jgi:endoglucanase
VFAGDPAGWGRLQHELLGAIRAALPGHTVMLTGQDWGGIGGLLALTPESDSNVVYSFHFYDPAELTSLAAYRSGLDRAALAGLPFPQTDLGRCQSVSGRARDPGTRDLILFYCATGWDSARVRSRILDAANWARMHDVTLMAGEFGASVTLNPAARLAWLRLVRETCAANAIGWALWGYDDVMGFNVPRPPAIKPVLDRSVRGALGLSVF